MPMPYQLSSAQTDPRIPRRPPGALGAGYFRDRCQRCGDCIAVCPLQAITPDREGFPRLIDGFDCIACGLCADACTRGAIEHTVETRIGIQATLAAERRAAAPRPV